MAHFAISWSRDGRPAVRALDPDELPMYVIGRDPGVEIVVPLPTVSRRQARLAWRGTHYELENLSTTNPVELDGTLVLSAAPVEDGARIRVGEAVLTIHDLVEGDRIGGPRCSNCGRENASGDPECWFCGTSLINAQTGMRSRRRLVLRLVDAAGGLVELFEGQTLRLRPDGGWDPVEDHDPAAAADQRPAIAIGQGRPICPAAGARVEDREGRRRTAGSLETGDVLTAAGRVYAAVTR